MFGRAILGAAVLSHVMLALLLLCPTSPLGAQSQNNASTRSPHGPLNIPCQNCHTQSGWKPIRNIPEFDHSQTRYPLRGMHQGVSCTQCHLKPIFTNVGQKCADCHADIHKRQFGANCEQCHSVKGWKVSLEQVQRHTNRFPLMGAHAALDCESCHKGAATGQFQGLSTQCYSCHAKDYQGTTGPPHASAGFSTSCDQCHRFDSWFGVKFDHLKNTGFALTGMHATLDCNACHIGGKFKGTPADCVGCHLPDFRKTTNPNHVASNFPQTCQSCHSTSAWQPASFDHNLVGFPLTGAHATLQCTQCHANGNYNLTTKDCASCHMKDYNGTNNPNHKQAGIPTTCATCHSTTSWANATFDHSTTGFPLTGKHVTTPCTQCHVNGNYNLKDTSCVSCHLKDYQGTTDPNHVKSGIPQTCQVCHNTASWGNAKFDHSVTGFPLNGAHTNLPCAQCHINGNYNLTTGACSSCHMKDYNNTNDPNHTQAGFPTTCETCHNTSSWSNAVFDHSKTGFPLTGKHTTTACSQCHVNGNYHITDTTCVSCHLKDYQNTNDPNHQQAGFPTTCQNCHDTNSWGSGKFDHSTTGFPLTGAHTTLPCLQCHVNGNYHLTSNACSACHMNDYNNTNDPNHKTVGFPTTCDTCHSTSSWSGAQFDHSKTGWPLTGSHQTLLCSQCHVNNNYKLTNTACVACHLNDYNQTNNPPHQAAGFPQTCEMCHDTVAWANGKFDHTSTGWPLTGAHLKVPCNQCHVNNNYKNLSTDCYSCHKKDYDNTTNPNHKAAGFPTTCQICHDTKVWTDATFDHKWFPMNHGGAKTCNNCHTNPSNYAIFSCTICHGKSQTDNEHQGVKGYVYNSTNCYQCHPTGHGG